MVYIIKRAGGELSFSCPGHGVLSNTLHAMWNFISGIEFTSPEGNGLQYQMNVKLKLGISNAVLLSVSIDIVLLICHQHK